MISINIGNTVSRTQRLVDRNMTVREVLAEYMPDPVGRLYLNCVPLDREDFDKKLSELDVQDSGNSLIAVQDKNAGATIRVDGTTMKVISQLTPEGIERLAKYAPETLERTEYSEALDYKESVKIGLALEEGEINDFSISFNRTPTASGKAWVTATLPEGLEDPKQYVAETYGCILTFLNEVEAKSAPVLEEIETKINAMKSAIMIVED